MGQCLAKFQDGGTQNKGKDIFPDYYTESQICDYYVDRLPPRLLGEGLHLLRGGPGPIVCSWTHDLLNDAGVRTYQDRELLLKTRDEIVAAVQVHRQRLRASRPSLENPKSRTSSNSPDQLANTTTNTTSPGSETTGNPKSPSSSGGPNPPDAATSEAVATPFDKAAARQATAAAEAAAAAAAADAAAAATAFRSEGDGKSFRLTTDWLPAGLQLYRISEEMRHMASSGLGGAANSTDVSAHGRSSVFGDVSVSSKAAAAAAAGFGGSSPVQVRCKSRLATVSSGGPAEFEDDGGERDDNGSVRDRDDAAAAAVAAAAAARSTDKLDDAEGTRRADGVESGDSPSATSGAPLVPAAAAPREAAAAPAVATGGGCSCDSPAGSSGGGSGSGGECSGSSGSGSPGSTLGAESLAALTSLEPTGGMTSTLPSPVEPSPLGAFAAGAGEAAGGAAADALCARSGRCDAAAAAAAAVLRVVPHPGDCREGSCCGGGAQGPGAQGPGAQGAQGPEEQPQPQPQPHGGATQLGRQEQGQIISAA